MSIPCVVSMIKCSYRIDSHHFLVLGLDDTIQMGPGTFLSHLAELWDQFQTNLLGTIQESLLQSKICKKRGTLFLILTFIFHIGIASQTFWREYF